MRTTSSCIFLLVLVLIASACSAPAPAAQTIQVSISVDGGSFQIELPQDSTVDLALEQANITLSALDRCEPERYALLSDGSEIKVVRVTEKFEIQQELIPFESQTLQNESLPKDQEILIQAGKNGLREITYRQVIEDGVLVDSQPIPVKSVVLEEPLPQIRMVGVQSPFAPIQIVGQMFYIRDGNLWLIEGNTTNRRPVLTSGDMDGRIFSISKDGQWLLFSRHANQEEKINSLWAVNLWEALAGDAEEADLIDLEVDNVIHFADFRPGGETRIVFSTVEPRTSAPGWQANNDLQALVFSGSGWTTQWSTLVDPNSGGIYGWWGTDFAWSQDGAQLAFSRPDGIGLVDFEEGVLNPIWSLPPLQTRGDWAWMPGMAWQPKGEYLYTVDHPTPSSAASPEELQWFDLISVNLESQEKQVLVSQSGMFAYPMVSPAGMNGLSQIAYLQAIFPNQSETSRYQLAVVNEDGSNQKILFPSDTAAGFEPTRHWGAWSPEALPESQTYSLAVIYQGNLWLVDPSSAQAYQITGDNLTVRVLWK